MTRLPDFATNPAANDATACVADRVNELFRLLRENKMSAPPVSIATAYINPGGFALLADELEHAPRVRLLLGAEPDQDAVRAVSAHDAATNSRISAAIEQHDDWLAKERDAMGFARQPDTDAQRMVQWLRSELPGGAARVEVRRLTRGFLHGKAYLVEDAATPAALAGSSNMTYAGLALNAELNLGTGGGTHAAAKVHEWFDHFWAMSDPYDLASLYERRWDPHSPWLIYLRMLWEQYGSHVGEESPHITTGLSLTRFQSDGVARMQRLLHEHGGVLVADEVGLGKTYLAGEVIYQTANINRQRVLIVAPAALKTSMWVPFLREHDFSRWVSVYSYEEVRTRLSPGHPSHDTFMREIEDYSLVVIDEAHNLRNSSAQRSGAVDQVITAGGQPKKVVLLTATPVNNSLTDLETLVKYFIRDDARFASLGIPSIGNYIKRAQEIDPANLTPEHLFDLMDQVAVRRTRKFVKEHYTNDIIAGADGTTTTITFPQPKVRRLNYNVSDDGLILIDAMMYALDDPGDPHAPTAWEDRVQDPNRLMLARYLSSMYTLDQNLLNYQITNVGLLRSGLLKRLESSPAALRASLDRMLVSHESFLDALQQGQILQGDALNTWVASDSDDLDAFVKAFDDEDQISSANNYHVAELEADVTSDIALLRRLRDLASAASKNAEPKVTTLIAELTRIAADARRIDPRGVSSTDRRKTIIFSAFSDTIITIYDAVIDEIAKASPESPLRDYLNRVAPPIMGSYAKVHERGESGGVDQGGRASTIAGFAPKTAGPQKANGDPQARDEYDIVFATDVLAEGMNLQQAGQIINYDLPWNPMRIVQRHGRVDRIGSLHDYVHLGLFFPSERLDELLRLEERLQDKLALTDAAIGAGEVLPGRGPGHEVNLTDDHVTDEFEDLLATGGSSASLSGEEYRRRLFGAFTTSTTTKTDLLSLPYGSGSGFESPSVRGNGYVFCMRIGDSDKPWFRYVAVDDNWNVARDGNGAPRISGETLLSLRVADPENPETPRWLDEHVYDRAFDAWEVARIDAFTTWDKLTDPNALQPDMPLSFRDAQQLIFQTGGFLGRKAQIDIANRLRSVPSPKVARQMRRALNEGRTDEERIALITDILDTSGIIAPPSREPLPSVELHEVRLVAWMAIKGTRETGR